MRAHQRAHPVGLIGRGAQRHDHDTRASKRIRLPPRAGSAAPNATIQCAFACYSVSPLAFAFGLCLCPWPLHRTALTDGLGRLAFGSRFGWSGGAATAAAAVTIQASAQSDWAQVALYDRRRVRGRASRLQPRQGRAQRSGAATPTSEGPAATAKKTQRTSEATWRRITRTAGAEGCQSGAEGCQCPERRRARARRVLCSQGARARCRSSRGVGNILRRSARRMQSAWCTRLQLPAAARLHALRRASISGGSKADEGARHLQH